MTPRQIELARRALGLENNRPRSYRNRYVTSPQTPEHNDWLVMVAAGHAIRTIGAGLFDVFHLTRQGAERVLRSGESLDPEDFPPQREPA